jgi:hypothetical protein
MKNGSINIIDIKVLVTGTIPTQDELDSLLRPLGNVLSCQVVPMIYDGKSLIPAPVNTAKVEAEMAAERAATKKKSSPDPKPTTTKKQIHFEPGSDAEKIWVLLRDGAALTSTQVREKLNLKSGIVNTTIYRLKNAGMIRPMSYNAPNGDTLYTSTHLDAKE